jgi:hypothetical protein
MVKNISSKNINFYSMVNTINLKVKLRARCGKVHTKHKSCTSCSICLDSKSQESIELVCGHKFHKSCFLKWSEHSLNYSCPLCRQDSKSIFSKLNNTKKKYKLFIKRFLNKNINLFDSENNLILNINCKNIYQLLNYNYQNILEKNYNYNNQIFKSNKVLFEIDDIKITHFLRDIIIFGSNQINIQIKKEFTNDQEYYYDTKLDIINNFNKLHLHDNYSLYEKIYQLLEQKFQQKFSYQHLFHIWDLSFQYAGINKVDIFKVIRYMLVNYIQRNYNIDLHNINESIDSIRDIVIFNIPSYDKKEYNEFKMVIEQNVNNIINGIVRL